VTFLKELGKKSESLTGFSLYMWWLLVNEIGSPGSPLTVLPALGKANDAGMTTNDPRQTSNMVVSKCTLSWADVASGRKRE
jgi:hypothetical protein